ncbi:hypothetical protein [Desulfosporosinus shakirovi]|uniref:hypothetical protein n=1 Tax=Desulfosporosinus shakirovi TaxID=2885154 RepID=UPI001E43305F|nr:hypothetical protein [Desulfosporosinus sp. SRJS8]MCB8818621.1 hypothetical protein [Desulfosporosinus sp. SRJS8]
MRKKWIPLILMVIIAGAAISGYFNSPKRGGASVVPADVAGQAPQQSYPPTEQQSSAFSPDTFEHLQAIDQETIRDLVQKVRRLGNPYVTPADCSLLTMEDAHFAVTSFWDPDYIRKSDAWKTSVSDNLWDPSLKGDITKPGAWMVAMLTKSDESDWQDVVLRWDAPPSRLIPPPVSLPEPIAQACNSGWNELLKQNYLFFSFVKATASQNTLQLHFTVVKTDKPQKVVVSVPINGTYKSWSFGNISIQDE